MKVIQKENDPTATIFLLIFKYILTYIAFNPLFATVLFCISFIIFTLINLTAGDLTIIGVDKIVNFIGYFGFITKETYNKSDLLKFFSLASLFLTIVSIALSKLIALIIKRDFVIPSKTKFIIGVGVITLLMLIALLSIFLPNASNNGARSIWPILLIFWLISLACYAIYSVITVFVHKLENIG